MSKVDILAERFLERHPREAAAVLEALGPEATAELVAALPDECGVDLLMSVSRALASACLIDLPDDRAAGYLGAMPRRDAAAILGQLAPAQRATLWRSLPVATRLQIEVVLNQPGHRTGAWMDSDPLAFRPETTVDTARQRLRDRSDSVVDIYTVDANQRPVGVVSLSALLKLPDGATLAAAARPVRVVLQANATVETALVNPAWEELDSLPVIDSAGRLVGSVRHATLRKAVAEPPAVAVAEAGGDYMNLANNVYVGLADVLVTSIAKSTSSEPRKPEGGTNP